MTPPDRRFLIKRALLRALADSRGYPLLDSALRDAAEIKVDFLRPTMAEIDEQLRIIETERLAVAVESERGRKFQLTDAGTLWLASHA